ncbi:hypothetical protein EJP77_03090 [Paenibacillus zeisoli]|uniref:Uncharacterized protein n=1 Tax=Paenibacillus zeisoli TaxID=2496267 RepID=A0A433XPK8_9BACL|nr:hypothetical protein [Paenibacillus zeisoli]RUT35999.1 hypothetical protein EJP77_03090 [Paenibacillus zeisoli]
MKARVLMLSTLLLAVVVLALIATPFVLEHDESSKTTFNANSKTATPNYGLIPGFFGGPVIEPFGNRNSGFPVLGGYGYVKLYFKNKSSSPVKVVVTHVKTNKTYIAKTIPGKGSYTWYSTGDYPHGVRSGKYTVLMSGVGNGTKPVDASWRGFTTNSTTMLK